MKRLYLPYCQRPIATVAMAFFIYFVIALLAPKIFSDPDDQIMTEEEEKLGTQLIVLTVITSLLVAPLLVGKKSGP